jgi:hypothetical protein
VKKNKRIDVLLFSKSEGYKDWDCCVDEWREDGERDS